MSTKIPGDKLAQFRNAAIYSSLDRKDQSSLEELASNRRLSVQQLRQVLEIARDIQMWGIGPISSWIEELPPADPREGKRQAMKTVDTLVSRWEEERRRGPVYTGNAPVYGASPRSIMESTAPATILGSCPVASEKTRCCNLQTLDAVINCGFGCTYCTIQSFYDQGRIYLHSDLGRRLRELQLDTERIYHIGTGQSSDSLMWGNRENLLADLFDFARRNPNVILELKTKSDNISWLLENSPPPNVLVTWSLNSEQMIRWEERGTAPLEKRLNAAARTARAGYLVGFHFHPMVPHNNWRESYAAVFSRLLSDFDPSRVAMTSFGTLTFIKPVIRAIRERGQATQVLRMPLTETAGKYSYPEETKVDLFRFGYESLAAWHGKVFFYLCMEPAGLWEPVFGFSYPDNENFEEAMKEAYRSKILSPRF